MKIKKILPYLIGIGILISLPVRAVVLQGNGGGTGISTSTPPNDGLCLVEASSTPFLTYRFTTCATGGSVTFLANGLAFITTSTINFQQGTNVTITTSTNGTYTISSVGGSGVATTSINGTQSATFRLIGDGIGVTSTVSGATTTFSIINTGNWAGTWQGVNSTTFYLASNPNGYITTSTNNFGGLTNASITGISPIVWSTTSSISCPTCYLTSNPSGYISSSTGNTLYYPLSGNPSGFVTSSGITSINGGVGPAYSVTCLIGCTITTSTNSTALSITSAGASSTVAFLANGSVFLSTSTINFQQGTNVLITTSTNGTYTISAIGGLASTTPFTVGNIVVVSSSGALSTISSSTYYLSTNPNGYVTSSGITSINGGTSSAYNILPGTNITISTSTSGTTINATGGSTSTLSSPIIITGVATGTIYGSNSSSYIANFNTKLQFPSPSQLTSGATCGITTGVTDAGVCHNDIYQWMASSSEIDYGSYSYTYSTPIINNIANKYVVDKGIGGGGTQFTFTPTYFAITSAATSTARISYTTAGTPFSGEPVTAVGPSLPSGLTVGTLYYIGNITGGTFILYKDALLTQTSTISATGVGTLATPAWTYDIGQNPSYGWGSDGITLNGPANGSSTGWYYGGTQGARSSILENGSVTGFYYNIYTGDNTYFWTMQNEYSHRNAPNTSGGGLLFNDATSNSDEEMNLIQSVLADYLPAASSTAVSQGVHLQTSGFADWECNGTSFDDAGVFLDWYDGQNNSFHAVNCRWENPGVNGGGWTAYVPITTNAGNPNTSVDIGLTNVQFLNDGNGANAFTNMMQVGPNVKVSLTDVSAAANTYIGATTVPVFMTLGTNSTVASVGFGNQGDTPGVTYLYNSRVPTPGFMTNASTFLDSTEQVTGNFTYYNGFIGNPVVSAVSSTLLAFSPNYQICNGTSGTPNYTLPTVTNNTGLDFDIANRGTVSCTVTRTGSDFIYSNGATSTSLTIGVGQGIRIIDDATYWTLISNTNFSSGGGGGSGNLFVTPTSSVTAGSVPYYIANSSSTVSATSSININSGTGKATFSGDVSTEIGTLYTHSLVGTGGTFQQQQSGSNNYFVGNLAVGTSSPGNATLYVNGSSTILQGFNLGTSTTGEGNVRWANNGFNSYLGIYDGPNAIYYGISPSCQGAAGFTGICGYYHGVAVQGTSNAGNNPIFGVLNSSQSGNGLGNVAFTITDTNQVYTFNNTLDNGSGNASFSGKTTILGDTSVGSTTDNGRFSVVNASNTIALQVASTTNNSSSVNIIGLPMFLGSSTVITPTIGGAIIGAGCDTATSSVDTSITSSTAVFLTTPQNDPNSGANADLSIYSFLSAPGVITTRVCASASLTPASTPYVVKIIK